MLTADQYKAIFEATPDAILVVATGGAVRDANARALELFGYERDALVGQRVEVLVPEALRGAHERHRDQYAEAPKPRPMGIGLELQARRSDGALFPVEISLSPWHDGEAVNVICAVRDISDRTRLRSFGVSTLKAAEEERRRIARELHDDTAQRLAALMVRLRLAMGTEDDDEQQRHVEEARRGLQEAVEGVRRIARGLRPPELEDAGLAAAIQAHVRQLGPATNARLETHVDPVDAHLDQNAQLILYRVVQEALSNAIRHADASNVTVRVQLADGVVVAEVVDDGRGFDPKALFEAGAGLGLVGMQERATMVGGRLSIDGDRGSGVVVRLEIPSSREVLDG